MYSKSEYTLESVSGVRAVLLARRMGAGAGLPEPPRDPAALDADPGWRLPFALRRRPGRRRGRFRRRLLRPPHADGSRQDVARQHRLQAMARRRRLRADAPPPDPR